jgi:hypothetical protein
MKPTKNLQMQIRVQKAAVKINGLIMATLKPNYTYKIPSKWHHLFQELRRRTGFNTYRMAGKYKCDLLFAVAKGFKLIELENLADELFEDKKVITNCQKEAAE